MAHIKIPRPDLKDLAGDSSIKDYIEKLINELEYILTNLDEDNMTEQYKTKHPEEG